MNCAAYSVTSSKIHAARFKWEAMSLEERIEAGRGQIAPAARAASHKLAAPLGGGLTVRHIQVRHLPINRK
jgi:hypothetical protein